MTTSEVESETFAQIDPRFNHEQANTVIETVLPQFEQWMKFYVYFQLFFLVGVCLEIVLFINFFTFFAKSSILALSLAIIFLTFFSYFILKIYFQTRKSEQFKEIGECYITACKKMISYQVGIPEHHIALAKACCQFSNSLHRKEYGFYRLPNFLKKINPQIEKFSCWWHWQDVHRMREFLLKVSVQENIQLVKCEPTSLEVHAALANAYVMLSSLYVDPRKLEDNDEDRWVSPERHSENFEFKFRSAAERAIEEFKILNSYAPNDPWVHAQLAYSYHDLQMPKEEIQEYEIMLKLNPTDKDTLYKLGTLYFQQGLNAQGLKVYEELKRSHYGKAENLIRYYGIQSYKESSFFN